MFCYAQCVQQYPVCWLTTLTSTPSHVLLYTVCCLISHPSKVMLKVILNRLKPQAEKIIAEEQAGFRAGRSTTEQIFNLRILCEKYLQHQQVLYHVFIDFKKAFDRVWHATLWATMKKYSISTNLIQVIRNLHSKATSAILFNSSIEDWFQTTVGVWQGCLLSPILFNIFLERIMTDTLEDHEGTVSIGDKTITNRCFADDIDGLAWEEEEPANSIEHLDKASTAYGTEIKVNGQKLETVTSFKYLGSVITDEGSKPGILSRIAQTTSALTRLKPVWNEQGKMEKTGCEIICGTPTTLAVNV